MFKQTLDYCAIACYNPFSENYQHISVVFVNLESTLKLKVLIKEAFCWETSTFKISAIQSFRSIR